MTYTKFQLKIVIKKEKILQATVQKGNAVIRLQDAVGAILLDEDLLNKENNIERIVEIVNEQVKAEAEKDRKSRHDYVVYTLVDSEGIVRYVGRTKDYERRMKEHEQLGGKNSNII